VAGSAEESERAQRDAELKAEEQAAKRAAEAEAAKRAAEARAAEAEAAKQARAEERAAKAEERKAKAADRAAQTQASRSTVRVGKARATQAAAEVPPGAEQIADDSGVGGAAIVDALSEDQIMTIGRDELKAHTAMRAPEPEAETAPRPTIVTTPRVAPDPATADVVLAISGLHKRFGGNVAVDGVSLNVRQGSFYGIVGPNGAGKTTTLSMVTGLLRPDAGTVHVHGLDVWKHPTKAKRAIGVLPDRLRLFDRLTGAQLLYYSGTLRGLDATTVRERSADLAAAFGLEDALGRLVADYSAGMTKKVALAAAMIHSPRLLVLDEPFESVDPVSAANVIEILQRYVEAGGTVVLSSHGMDMIQRICDSVAIIVHGTVLDAGTIDEVRGDKTLEERFVELAGGRRAAEGMEWLHSFSD
jgi:ABC-2 type transport system ATP-binding protein